MVLIVGHRGDPAHFPDNSLAGFRSAMQTADMAELDVRRTADGAPVLSHDARVAGRLLVEIDAGEATALEPSPGHPIVTLQELFGAVGDFPLNIEIKNHPGDPDHDPSHRFALEVAAMARPRDLVTCFDWPTVHEIRRTLPAVQTGLLVDARQDVVAAVVAARTAGHRALAVHWSSLAGDAAGMVAAAEGLDIFVWTVNDPTVATVLAGAGVAGIITDDPAAMKAAIQEQA